MKKLLFTTLLLSFHLVVQAQEAFSTLEERMSGKEFKQTGLSKLTDTELSELNEWVRSHSVATLENASARPAAATAMASVSYADETADTRGFENQPKTNDDGYNDTIHSNIVGTFTGWVGNDNEFTLANGMIWKQVEGDTFNVKARVNPEVTIKRTMLGAWRLSMVGYNNTVRVKRIQ